MKKSKEEKILSALKAFGIISFIAAAVLIVVFIVIQIGPIQEKYQQFLTMLEDFEYAVAALQHKMLILLVIFLLYLLRSLSAFFPYTMIYFISAMVFTPFQSLLINIAGMAFTSAFRYYTGVEMGKGYVNNALEKHPTLNDAFEQGGRFNLPMLIAIRLVPLLPFNTISHLYGSYRYPFFKYLIISVAALLPRLISYSFMGKNVWDPLSGSFLIPLIILLIFSGFSIFFMRGILKISIKLAKNKSSERKNEDE